MDINRFYSELGRSLAARRKALGVTQTEIALRAGVTRASIANIEGGRQKLQLHQVYPLARAMELDDIADLLPTAVPMDVDDLVFEAREDVSETQLAQIESVLRLALAKAGSKADGT